MTADGDDGGLPKSAITHDEQRPLNGEKKKEGGEGVGLDRGVVVETGAVVEAYFVGEGSVIEVGATIGRGSVIGKVSFSGLSHFFVGGQFGNSISCLFDSVYWWSCYMLLNSFF